MSWIRRFRNLFREERMAAEFEEEMRFHMEERAAELTSEGFPDGEACRQALLSFGNLLARREEMRDAKIVSWLADLRQDLRYACRTWRRHPGILLAAVGSLSLAIGANCAVFTVLNALVLKPLPVQDAGSLVHLYVPPDVGADPTKTEDDSFSYPLFLQIKERAEGAAELFAAGREDQGAATFAGQEQAAPVRYQCISGDAFRILGLRSAHGRLLTAADDIHPGGHPVAVLSYGFWQREFGKASDVVGQTVALGGQRYEILGVAPKGFTGIDVGTMLDVWIPLTMWQPTEGLVSPDWRNFRILGRMRPGVGLEQLRARVQAVYSDALREKVRRAFPDGRIPKEARQYLSRQVRVRPAPAGPSRLRVEFLEALTLLAGVAGLVLLVACCNVANLMLARAASRQPEMAMRVSLGASRSRLLRQMLTEGLLIGVLSSVCGLLLAVFGAPSVVGLLAESDNPVLISLDLDWRVLAFLIVTCFVTTLACGLAPAIRAFGARLTAQLQGNRVAVSGGRAGRLLVLGQVAMSFVLVGASVLFALSLRNLLTLDAGFNRNEVILAEVEATAAGQEDGRAREAWENLRTRIDSISGVRGCAYSTWGLFSGNRRTAYFTIPGQQSRAIETIMLGVSPNFFETMGTRLVRGRDFLPSEDRSASQPIILNQTAARQLFNGEEPIDRSLQQGLNTSGPTFRIIGIVADAKYRTIREAAPPTVYVPEEGSTRATFAIRTAVGVAAVTPQLKAVVGESRSGLRVRLIQTQAAAVERTLIRERMLAKLSGLFAILGALLASVGVYGVLSYFVARQTKEIGIRSALGASKLSVAKTVLAHLWPAFLLGIVAGGLATAALARFAETLVFGLGPRDPVAFALTGAILVAAGAAAALLPTLRATRIDPALSLRWD